MIWYFIAGFIAGMIGTIMFAGWYVRQHTVVMRMEKDDECTTEHPGDVD